MKVKVHEFLICVCIIVRELKHVNRFIRSRSGMMSLLPTVVFIITQSDLNTLWLPSGHSKQF